MNKAVISLPGTGSHLGPTDEKIGFHGLILRPGGEWVNLLWGIGEGFLN